jgi:lipoyl(octanoyl) transferase
MQTFTQHRRADTDDEFWLVEHFPVFTQGLNGKARHILDPGDIPIIQIDRGGQVTYHGPGQVVIYLLIDLRRRGLGVRRFVTHIEQAMIDFLGQYGINAKADPVAPGVYVAERKIASIGLRVRRGCSYHGLAFNLNMDLSPFKRINPCGHQDLQMTQLADLGIDMKWRSTADQITDHLIQKLGYTHLTKTMDQDI